MSAVTKALSSLIIIPGLGGVGYVTYEALKPYPDYVQKIYEAQDKYGGCIFGLANKYSDLTGGFPNQAIGSTLETGSPNKLKQLHTDIDGSTDIQNKCKERKRQILELSGQTSKGEFKNETWTSHSLPTVQSS